MFVSTNKKKEKKMMTEEKKEKIELHKDIVLISKAHLFGTVRHGNTLFNWPVHELRGVTQ